MRDDLTGLTALLAVARRRSFTSAAAELGVTPSAVSQTLAVLEQRLGVRLVQRTTRSVGLTEAGARFVDRLEPALAEVRGALESLNELRDRPAGTLRLNVPSVACRQLLQPTLGEFLAAHPDIRLEVRVEDAFGDIIADGFDAGIRLGETLGREMIAVPITAPDRSAVVGSPAYFKAHGKPKHPRELLEHDCINYRLATRGGVYRWEFTEDGKDFEMAVDGRLLANDWQLMLHGALDGVGLAYLLESSVREPLKAKRLVRVLEDYCPPFPGFFLYYPSRAGLSPKLRALVEFFRHRRERKR
jgi:DNA-binding transcriptional LysR family regulator